MHKSRDELIREINIYKQNQHLYVKLSEILRIILKKISKVVSSEAIVQIRAKPVQSFAEKIQRPGKAHLYGENDFMEKMTDLCGGRIVLPTLDSVKECGSLIKDNFLWEEYEDKLELLNEDQFGYLSDHYIVQIDPKSPYAKELDIPQEILTLKAEIQVRTFIQHSWSVNNHDYIYKQNFKIPEKIKRQFNRIAAMIEELDIDFKTSFDSLRKYDSNYGGYMTETEINEQIRIYELVHDIMDQEEIPAKIEYALKIAKLARYLGKWKINIDLLSKYAEYKNSVVLRELGLALYKHHSKDVNSKEYKLGQEYCEKATKLDPTEPENFACLGGSWKNVDLEKSFKYFSEAYTIDPNHNYAAVNYFLTKIALEKNLDIIQYSLPAIKNMITLIEKDISFGIDIPWSYFNNGLFNLFYNKIFESLNNYLLAIRYCNHGWMISTHLKDLDFMSLKNAKLPGLDLVKQLLLIGLAAKFNDKEARSRLINEFNVLENELSLPLVIVAGTTNVKIEEMGRNLKENLINGFKSYEGTIISGGTTSGICEIVGDLQNEYQNSIRSLGYVPSQGKGENIVDKRYTKIHNTSGTGFNLLESIQYWTDIVNSGIDISKIKLLGVGGGKISEFECKLAMILGAKVGLIETRRKIGLKISKNTPWTDLGVEIVNPTVENISKFINKKL